LITAFAKEETIYEVTMCFRKIDEIFPII